MQKVAIHTLRNEACQATRTDLQRPQRPSGLNGSVVGTVLNSADSVRRRLNDYLVLLHLAGGLWLLAFCVEDIAAGGPSRPTIVPVLGAYMSVSLVFHTVLKRKSPTLLLWINGLSDVVFVVAAHRLAFMSFWGMGADLTAALLIMLMSLVYGAGGHARLMLAVSGIVTVFVCFTLVSPATGYPALDAQSVTALAMVAMATIAGYRLARFIQRRELTAAIFTLERVDAAVTTHRMRGWSASASIRH